LDCIIADDSVVVVAEVDIVVSVDPASDIVVGIVVAEKEKTMTIAADKDCAVADMDVDVDVVAVVVVAVAGMNVVVVNSIVVVADAFQLLNFCAVRIVVVVDTVVADAVVVARHYQVLLAAALVKALFHSPRSHCYNDFHYWYHYHHH
jgi:hypothetical protein